jgi:hypothetical protein
MAEAAEVAVGAGAPAGMETSKTPADFLKSIRGRPVVVKLNSGVDYRGTIALRTHIIYYIACSYV